MIDYCWVTENTQKEFEAVLRQYGLKFLRWRSRNETRKKQAINDAYKAWWMQGGPLDFHTNEDAFRFRTDLLDFVKRTMLDEPNV